MDIQSPVHGRFESIPMIWNVMNDFEMYKWRRFSVYVLRLRNVISIETWKWNFDVTAD